MKEEMKTAEEILDKAIPNYRDGYKVGPSHKEDHIYNAILKAMEEYAEQARREERDKIKSEMENLKFTAEDMAEFAEWFSRNWDLDFKADQGLEVWLKEREQR